MCIRDRSTWGDITSDGKFLVLGHTNGKMSFHDIESEKTIVEIKEHFDTVNCVSSIGQSMMVSSSGSRRYDLESHLSKITKKTSNVGVDLDCGSDIEDEEILDENKKSLLNICLYESCLLYTSPSPRDS
eukprot:TRINITY_DN6563_c0_g1_i1.p2 TRINITY_DN6563_c0_g1~~TRINITY_DN6563_c0_g1_i1.p2  ORF type:complete len:129 (+),score=26.41 TRINITY_DN6563_c0_g1_i1:63-449(+)